MARKKKGNFATEFEAEEEKQQRPERKKFTEDSKAKEDENKQQRAKRKKLAAKFKANTTKVLSKKKKFATEIEAR